MRPRNLYIHFPFCRRKCSYCALHSRAGVSQQDRDEYVRSLVEAARGEYATVYFGGGSPALCDLRPLLDVVKGDEFTVELHPLDVTKGLLATLKAGGVNRISMGVQSLDDAILSDMGRGYTFDEAEKAFALVKSVFDNAGIDLIVGYPGETGALIPRHARLVNWGLRHCSVYSLILEEKTLLWRRFCGDRPRKPREQEGVAQLPEDDIVLDRIGIVARFLHEIGLERYEISNYSVSGFECRHNLAVWRGEDYLGIGEGAHGRVGLKRTEWLRTGLSESKVTPEEDEKERCFFRLRTREGLDASRHPEWEQTLGKYCEEGLLTQAGTCYRLTDRGTEVCDSILLDLV